MDSDRVFKTYIDIVAPGVQSAVTQIEQWTSILSIQFSEYTDQKTRAAIEFTLQAMKPSFERSAKDADTGRQNQDNRDAQMKSLDTTTRIDNLNQRMDEWNAKLADLETRVEKRYAEIESELKDESEVVEQVILINHSRMVSSLDTWLKATEKLWETKLKREISKKTAMVTDRVKLLENRTELLEKDCGALHISSKDPPVPQSSGQAPPRESGDVRDSPQAGPPVEQEAKETELKGGVLPNKLPSRSPGPPEHDIDPGSDDSEEDGGPEGNSGWCPPDPGLPGRRDLDWSPDRGLRNGLDEVSLVARVKREWPQAIAYCELFDHTVRRKKGLNLSLEGRFPYFEKINDPAFWTKMEQVQDVMRGDKSPYEDWPQRVSFLLRKDFITVKREALRNPITWMGFLDMLIEQLGGDVKVGSPFHRLCEFSREVSTSDTAMDVASKLHELAVEIPPAQAPAKVVVNIVKINLQRFTPELYAYVVDPCSHLERDRDGWMKKMLRLAYRRKFPSPDFSSENSHV